MKNRGSKGSRGSEDTVVGLGGSGHEWSSCAIRGGRVVAIAEERVTRKKYGIGADLLRAESRRACLKALGVAIDDVDHVVACSLVPRSFYHSQRRRTHVINHHLAHAYSSFAASGFERAAVLVLDNAGSILDGDKVGSTRSVETVSYFEGGPDGMELRDRVVGVHDLEAESESLFYQPGATSNSLGHLYRTASLALGFAFQGPGRHPVSEDGKTMGLAPYGDGRLVDRVAELLELRPGGQIQLELTGLAEALADCARGGFEVRAALAYAVQHHLERALLHCAEHLHRLTGLDDLCIAGGVGLNSVGCGRILRESPFRRVFVVPAPSDDGIALGCAYYGLHRLAGVPMRALPSLGDAYLGPPHDDAEVEAAIRASGLRAERPSNLVDVVADALADGQVVGWYQGEAEYGPRALGHRSIFSAPHPAAMRERINRDIKHREWFRPLAPLAPLERTPEYFDLPEDNEVPFMSIVLPVTRSGPIPAVTHVDESARIQTLRREANPLIYELIEAFERRAGCPVLLNTSFNHAGEPIVETPAQAIDAFVRMKLDVLVLQGRVLRAR